MSRARAELHSRMYFGLESQGSRMNANDLFSAPSGERESLLHRSPFLDNLRVADVRILPCSIIRRAQQMGFRSCSLVTESMHKIDAAGSPRRYEASRTSRRSEHEACQYEGEWVVRL
jgi:hypothetical protein